MNRFTTMRLEVVVVVPASSWDAVVVAVVLHALGQEEGSTYISYLAPIIMIINYTYIYIWVFPKIMVPPKNSILIGFSIIKHPFWGTPIFGNIHITYIFYVNIHDHTCISLQATWLKLQTHMRGQKWYKQRLNITGKVCMCIHIIDACIYI